MHHDRKQIPHREVTIGGRYRRCKRLAQSKTFITFCQAAHMRLTADTDRLDTELLRIFCTGGPEDDPGEGMSQLLGITTTNRHQQPDLSCAQNKSSMASTNHPWTRRSASKAEVLRIL